MMEYRLASALIVITGCSSAPPPVPLPPRPTATPQEEFEEITRELRTSYEKSPPIYFPSSIHFEPVDKQNRLTELGCTSQRLYDRLIDFATEPGLGSSLRFDHDSPCALGEEYSLGIVSKFMGEKEGQRRNVLLMALRHHSRHPHAREAAGQAYTASVPGRLASAYDALSEGERWLVVRIQAAYSPFLGEARDKCWARAADEREPSPVRARVFDALLREVFPGADAVTRGDMLQRFCDLIRSRCTGIALSYMDYAIFCFPPRSILSPAEFMLCESTLEEVALTAPRVEPRFHALRALAGLKSDRAVPLAEILLGEAPSENVVARAFGALDGHPSALDSVYSKTRHALFRAYADSRRITSLTGDLRDQTTRRLLGWLRDALDEPVRRVALYGLIEEVVQAIRNQRGEYGSALERASEVLDLVLRDPALGVRELAANYLSSYSRYLGYLDSATREKVDKLFESVRR